MGDEFSFAIPLSIYRVARSLGTSEANLNPRPLNLLNRFAKIFARCLRCRTPRPLLIRYGEFFSTLDKLAAAQDRDLRHRHRLRVDRRDLVLRHAEIYARRLSADPAGAVPARSFTFRSSGWIAVIATALSTWRRIRIFPNTQTCMNCHTQVQKDNPKLEPVRASWKTGQAGRVGAASSHARLRFLQSLRARESRDQLRELPRPGQSHAGRLSRQAAQHGVVPGMPSRIRKISCARKIRSSISIGNRRT